MAHTIVIQIEVQLPEDPQQWEDLQQWEEHAYQVGCAVARQVGEWLLQKLEEQLEARAKQQGWREVGKRTRPW